MKNAISKAMKRLAASTLVLGLAAIAMPALADTVEYLHTDALGTPIAVTDANGAVIETSEYAPYGQLLNRAIADGPGYSGHVEDAATGLVYMQQRYFDSNLGVFISPDLVTGYGSQDWRYLNKYRYAFASPYDFKDVDGHCPNCVGAVVGAIVGE